MSLPPGFDFLQHRGLGWLGVLHKGYKGWAVVAVAVCVAVAGVLESAKAGTAMVASKEQPFVNSLGMKFVPVPIIGGPTDEQKVLFSVWDTRVQDYEGLCERDGDWTGRSRHLTRGRRIPRWM